MNQMINATESKTMTSKELLDLINSARQELGEQPLRLNKFNEKIEDELEGDYYTKSVVQNMNNTESVIYDLTPDQCTLLSMRESKSVRRTVLVKLKERANPKITFSESLHLLADTVEAKERAEAQLAIAAPKVTYYDAVVDRNHLLNASQVAQKIKMSAVKLNRFLDSLSVYNNSVKSSRIFQQWFVDKGFGFVRQTELGYPQAMFTLAGEAWVIQKMVSEGIAQ
jgi:phage antirepressor YoqD-like protein